MAEILGLGLSHFGGFMFPDGDMASRIKARLADGTLPDTLDSPSKWPAGMQAEWGSDEGAGFAARHRKDYFAALDLATLESCGQHELVNWSPMVGAMAALEQKPDYCVLLESWLMNSNKCVTVIPPG